ncbi:MAG: cytochrome C assembly family protein [Gammaproteobacteria bacterium]
MNTLAIGLTAIILYVAAAARLAFEILRRTRGGPPGNPAERLLGFLALPFHGLLLYQGIVTNGGLNLGVFNAASLVAFVMATIILIATWRRPLENLAVVLLPLAALCIGMELIFPTRHVLLASAPAGLQGHILLSILAYSLLMVAALEAGVLAIEDHLLRARRPLRAVQVLPPLQTLEGLMFQLIGAGFFLLSLGLMSGMMFLNDIFAQHLVHKTVLSLLAWLVFAVLLFGRWRYGWRGRTAIRCTLGGFASLMLAYFGSKVVLELILHRV